MSKVSTHQTIEQKIADVASGEAFADWNYIYDGWFTINERMNSEALPAILNILPSAGRINVGLQQYTDIGECIIAFADKCEFDFDGEETDKEVVERLKRCADAFVLALNQSGHFKQITGEIPYSVMFDKLDCNVAIVAIQLSLEEVLGIPVCNTTTPASVIEYDE